MEVFEATKDSLKTSMEVQNLFSDCQTTKRVQNITFLLTHSLLYGYFKCDIQTWEFY